ncbi:MAG: hypothetical protein HY459_02155 [Parcubacteria group bacterium]|nr:hypothetical protein [Parcubacteria group bacterium]
MTTQLSSFFIIISMIGIVLTPKEPSKIPPEPSASPAALKRVMTTFFWVGEGAGEDNRFISNTSSAWVEDWVGQFGGIDDPDDRCGFKPCAFEPKENPFYFALPYDDLDDEGERKKSATRIPWYEETKDNLSVVKDRWIEIRYEGTSCYAQWEDVGPYKTDDFEYVFGSRRPRNRYGERAGLDISPAVRDCLGLLDNALVEWRFVESSEVPVGPWNEIVTE